MSKSPETLRVIIPLTIKKKNGRPKILPPDDLTPQQNRTQDPMFCVPSVGSLGWRRRLERGTASTMHDVSDAKRFSASYVARDLRLAYLSPEVLEAIILERRPCAVRVVDLVKIASKPWVEQVEAVFGER